MQPAKCCTKLQWSTAVPCKLVMKKICHVASCNLLHFMSSILQIGNQDEVMYFGAKNEKEQSEWMEAITLGKL